MKFLAAHPAAGILLTATIHLAHAAHPLVTDDAGTQGTGNNQIEINTDRARSAGTTERVAAFTYTYGVAPAVDFYANVPGTLSNPSGRNDASLGMKWRFFEDEGMSYAIKPELLLPTGDADKDLGNGRAGMALTMLATREVERWAFHGNLGVTYNRYKLPAAQQSNRRAI